jgi:hypothetical protein
MARGHKTGGRQKGTPNKRKAECDAKFAGAAGQATTGLPPLEIASMMPLDVLLFTMRLEVECGQLRSAASIAEKAALRPPKDGSASGGGRRPRTHDQDHRRPAGVDSSASELPPIASSCVYSSTFRLLRCEIRRGRKAGFQRTLAETKAGVRRTITETQRTFGEADAQ